MFTHITGIILAGGESTRMGQDKASIEMGGVSLVKKNVDLFRRLFGDVIVISKKTGRFGELGCREVRDSFPQQGAMIGLLTGLRESGTEYIFVTACDMPFLKEKVIELIIKKGEGFDVSLPVISGKQNPLHAIYSKRCYRKVLAFMEKEGKSLNRFINELPQDKVRIVTEKEIREIDPDALSLFNMNTPEEYEKAKEIINRLD